MELLCVAMLLLPVVFLVCMLRNVRTPAPVEAPKAEVRPREVARTVHARCRAAVEALYLLHGPEIAGRFSRKDFDTYVERRLRSSLPEEEVMDNTRGLHAIILQHVEQARLEREAARPQPVPSPLPYRQQLAAVYGEHIERLAALAALPVTTEGERALKDRAIENEFARYERELLAANGTVTAAQQAQEGGALPLPRRQQEQRQALPLRTQQTSERQRRKAERAEDRDWAAAPKVKRCRYDGHTYPEHLLRCPRCGRTEGQALIRASGDPGNRSVPAPYPATGQQASSVRFCPNCLQMCGDASRTVCYFCRVALPPVQANG